MLRGKTEMLNGPIGVLNVTSKYKIGRAGQWISFGRKNYTVDRKELPYRLPESGNDRGSVRIGRGMTLNLGNFSSARVDVSLELPFHVDDMEAATDFIDEKVRDKVKQDIDEIIDRVGDDKDPGAR